jgi:hypothetical protein
MERAKTETGGENAFWRNFQSKNRIPWAEKMKLWHTSTENVTLWTFIFTTNITFYFFRSLYKIQQRSRCETLETHHCSHVFFQERNTFSGNFTPLVHENTKRFACENRNFSSHDGQDCWLCISLHGNVEYDLTLFFSRRKVDTCPSIPLFTSSCYDCNLADNF